MKVTTLLISTYLILVTLVATTPLNAESENHTLAVVTVTAAKKASRFQEITLPGTLSAIKDTSIRARTNGYIASYVADIGDKVKEGQLLATIESPETDQELNQALANYEQAKANLALAEISAKRWKTLGAENAVSKQEVDQKEADYLAKKADLNVAKANVKKYQDLKSYEKITAPFSGYISARSVDIGTLINAGSGPELFHITQSDMLRAYVNIPQTAVRNITNGQKADILIAEYPHAVFSGTVSRTSSALDANSRTRLIEVLVPNQEGKILPGMYCQVHFKVPQVDPAIIIPSNNAIIRAEGTLVAIVNKENKIHLQHVTLGRDFGTEIEILDGLKDGENIIDNPSDSLQEGQEVQITSAQKH
jgi:membrane fusion protein, multidrug efflux system